MVAAGWRLLAPLSQTNATRARRETAPAWLCSHQVPRTCNSRNRGSQITRRTSSVAAEARQWPLPAQARTKACQHSSNFTKPEFQQRSASAVCLSAVLASGAARGSRCRIACTSDAVNCCRTLGCANWCFDASNCRCAPGGSFETAYARQSGSYVMTWWYLEDATSSPQAPTQLQVRPPGPIRAAKRNSQGCGKYVRVGVATSHRAVYIKPHLLQCQRRPHFILSGETQ